MTHSHNASVCTDLKLLKQYYNYKLRAMYLNCQLINIKILAGNYQLIFTQPKHEDSGTYRCEFDQMGVSVSTDVTIDVMERT